VRADAGLTRLSGVPVIARVPKAAKLGRRGAPLLKALDQPSAFQEAIRMLFAQCFLMQAPRPQVLLVTSSTSGEGKTFLTLSMACFAAATNRRVLVIECDLRRPRFAELLQIRPAVGLSHYLRGQAKFPDIIVRAPGTTLDVITAGRAANDSTELLSNGGIQELLQAARAEYDVVLIDSPPSLLLFDARLLTQQADGTIYCVSWGRSQVDNVIEGLRGIEAAGGRVLGLAVAMVQPSEYPLYETHAALPLPGLAGT
jgi:capsular exopolysaccharide synthesis family protein